MELNDKTIKNLEEHLKQYINEEIVNRIEEYNREILSLLHKINCYFPYLADNQTRALLEKDKEKILAYANDKTSSSMRVITEKVYMLKSIDFVEESPETEKIVSPEETDLNQEEINKSAIEDQLWNMEFLQQGNK